MTKKMPESSPHALARASEANTLLEYRSQVVRYKPKNQMGPIEQKIQIAIAIVVFLGLAFLAFVIFEFFANGPVC